MGGAWSDGSASSLVPAAELLASWGALESGWAGVLSLSGAPDRSEPFDGGQIHWHRFALGLGPRYRFPLAGRPFDVGASALAGLLWLHGSGYPVDTTDSGPDFGAQLGARWTWGPGPWAPWLGLEGRAWFRKQEAAVTGLPGALTLPSLEVAVSVGAQWNSL